MVLSAKCVVYTNNFFYYIYGQLSRIIDKGFCNIAITKNIQHGIVMVVTATASLTGTMGIQLLHVYLQNYGSCEYSTIISFVRIIVSRHSGIAFLPVSTLLLNYSHNIHF